MSGVAFLLLLSYDARPGVRAEGLRAASGGFTTATDAVSANNGLDVEYLTLNTGRFRKQMLPSDARTSLRLDSSLRFALFYTKQNCCLTLLLSITAQRRFLWDY
jgi:hypothetical protein